MSRKLLIFAVILAIVLVFFLLISGCKIDVADPVWERPFTNPSTPKITEVIPAQAIAGVNIITIIGENF
ncbi:MAG TPA: hypothetical protein VMT35_02775, partial [Ignavibacteriaceae bacterium]|nr:hypothetical protein [Ignavibacteriaceae bacterium]